MLCTLGAGSPHSCPRLQMLHGLVRVLVGLGLGGAAGFERCCPVPSTQRPSHRKGICSECPPGVLTHPLLGEHPSPSRSLPEPPSASAPSSWHPAHVHPGGSMPGTGARGAGGWEMCSQRHPLSWCPCPPRSRCPTSPSLPHLSPTGWWDTKTSSHRGGTGHPEMDVDGADDAWW